MTIYFVHEFCGLGILTGHSGVSYLCSTIYGLGKKNQMGVRLFCRLIPSCLMLALAETSADAVGRNSYICFSMWPGIPHTWWLGSKCDHPKTKREQRE